MFTCERCGSRYSPIRAAAMENCPRCQIRDRVSAPLALKVFQLPEGGISGMQSMEPKLPSSPMEREPLQAAPQDAVA